jgi:hypothetical protein
VFELARSVELQRCVLSGSACAGRPGIGTRAGQDELFIAGASHSKAGDHEHPPGSRTFALTGPLDARHSGCDGSIRARRSDCASQSSPAIAVDYIGLARSRRKVGICGWAYELRVPLSS